MFSTHLELYICKNDTLLPEVLLSNVDINKLNLILTAGKQSFSPSLIPIRICFMQNVLLITYMYRKETVLLITAVFVREQTSNKAYIVNTINKWSFFLRVTTECKKITQLFFQVILGQCLINLNHIRVILLSKKRKEKKKEKLILLSTSVTFVVSRTQLSLV